MKILVIMGLLLFSNTGNSSLVAYIVEGDLTRASSTDPYKLDGAHYVHEILVDTSAQYSDFVVGSDGNDRTEYYTDSNAWVSSVITITNRPFGYADATVVANQAYSLDFHIQNTLENYPHPNSTDGIAVGGANLVSSEFQGLRVAGLFYFFPKSYFVGSGPHALPDVIRPGDMIVAEANVSWSSSYSTGASVSSQYIVTNGMIYTATVPLPATLWLISSGILGLIGVAGAKSLTAYKYIRRSQGHPCPLAFL